MSAAPALLAFFIGVALLCAPWWSSTLPASDYPLVIVLGIVFAAIDVFAALPESWQQLRALSFALFMGTFGLVCAALALMPLHPAADGTLTIRGITGFAGSTPIPWWRASLRDFSRSSASALRGGSLWFVRAFFGRRPDEGGDPPA